MHQLLSLIKPKNPFEGIITYKSTTSHKSVSRELLSMITNNAECFISFMNTSQTPSTITKLALVNLILLHSSSHYQTLQRLILQYSHSNAWLYQNFLSPYQNFLRKIILSEELYQKIKQINLGWNSDCTSGSTFQAKQAVKSSPKDYFNLQLLCYVINLLQPILNILNKIPTLARYFWKLDGQYTQNFVTIASYQVTLLYFGLKFILVQLAKSPQLYLADGQYALMAEVVVHRLDWIGQEIKAILLNKYYAPVQKGIRTKIIEIDQHPPLMQLFLTKNIQVKPRQTLKTYKNRKFLKKQIFKDRTFDKLMFEESISIIGSSVYLEHDLEQIYDQENRKNISNIDCKEEKQEENSKVRVFGTVLNDSIIN